LLHLFGHVALFMLLASAPAAFGDEAAGPPANPPPDVAKILGQIQQTLAEQTKTINALKSEVDGLKRTPLNFTVNKQGDNFLPRATDPGTVDCPQPAQPPQPQNPAQPCQPGTAGGAGAHPGCNDENCKTTWVNATRLRERWVDSFKRVSVTKPTPYIALCNEWDPRSCCWRQVYVTKIKDETHEVIVPCKEKMIYEEQGIEKLTVCLDSNLNKK